jgi:hypothetical protein
VKGSIKLNERQNKLLVMKLYRSCLYIQYSIVIFDKLF